MGRLVVSGEERLRVYDLPGLGLLKETPLAGSGALCAGQGCIFCASDREEAIYRLDARTLLPSGVFAGGAQMRALCLSHDGAHLYALISGADSVWMLSAKNGALKVLARVGVHPQSMHLDDTAQRLIIAGGRDGCAHLLCARTLAHLRSFKGEGFCADAVCRKGRVRALRFSMDNGFGAAGKLICAQGRMLLLDAPAQRLMALDAAGEWRLVCLHAQDAAVTEGR